MLKERKIKLILFYINIYIYLLLKPYYFFKSGLVQISDIFLIVAFFIFFILNIKNIKNVISCVMENKYYSIFLVFVFIINSIYTYIYKDISFIKSISYYIFNFIAIILFSYALKNENFQKRMNTIMKINLMLQFLISIVGIGRMYSFRYMGTFNDPNQFAFFILITYSSIFIFNKKYKKSILIYLLISIFLIIKSSSTGMLLGISVFIVFEILNIILHLPKVINQHKKEVLLIILFTFIFLAVYGMISIIKPNVEEMIKDKTTNIKIFERIKEKLDMNEERNGLLEDRGYDRIYYYPQYILYGSGEGAYSRWNKASFQGELHATLPSILFCYGIIPLILVLLWMYTKVKKLPIDIKIIYIALLLESFTLINSRQALFWIIFIIGEKIVLNGEKNG